MTCTCGATGMPPGNHEFWCGRPETEDGYLEVVCPHGVDPILCDQCEWKHDDR